VKIGSLCTGYGGLDMAVEAYFDAEIVWCAENDKYASQLIVQRFNKPNLGDIKQIKWDEVEPIDILTAGYPCQPFSHAGQRKGTEDERHLWPYIIKAISTLRPKYIILENVRGHLSLGFSTVLANLTQFGYDTRWQIVRASDVGAPTKEQDFSLLPTPKVAGQGFNKSESKRNTPNLETTINLLPTPTAGDHKYRLQGKSQASQNLQALAILNLLPTPTAMHVRNHDEPIQAYEQRIMDYKEGKTKGKPGASTGLAVRWKEKQYRLHWMKVN